MGRWVVESSDIGGLVGRIFDPARTEPLVIVSPASDTRRPRVSVEELESLLPPMAELAELATMQASQRLTDATDPAFHCYGGSIRVILPGAARSDHWRRHRLFTIYPGDDTRAACQAVADFAAAPVSRPQTVVGPSEPRTGWRPDQLEKLTVLMRTLEAEPEAPSPAAAPKPGPSVVPKPGPPAPKPGPRTTTTPADSPAAAPAAPAPVVAKPGPRPVPKPGPRLTAPAEVSPSASVAAEAPAVAPVPAGPSLDDLTKLLNAQSKRITESVTRAIGEYLGDMLGDNREDVARERSRADAAEQELDALQRRLDQVLEQASSRERERPTVFADPEQQLRWEVEQEWLMGTPEHERGTLQRYTVTEQFLKGLDAPIVPRAKTVQIIVDVIAGRVWERRETHQFDDAARGGKQRVRDDGAVAWRTYVKAASPGAPRLLWWQLPDGSVELDHVGHHDDLI